MRVTLQRGPYATRRVDTGAMLLARDRRCHGRIDENGLVRDQVCGRMYLDELEHVVKVSGVGVDYYAQRGQLGPRVGTRLYETAARVACRLAGKPLVSDWRRTTKAESFWRKQVARGRARYNSAEDRYELSCPAPASLGRGAR